MRSAPHTSHQCLYTVHRCRDGVRWARQIIGPPVLLSGYMYFFLPTDPPWKAILHTHSMNRYGLTKKFCRRSILVVQLVLLITHSYEERPRIKQKLSSFSLLCHASQVTNWLVYFLIFVLLLLSCALCRSCGGQL